METIICCTASEARGNPGPAAIGVYITDVKGEHISEVSKSIGNASSNFAEYYAAMVGLQTLQSLYEEDTTKMIFELRLSNELVKKQLNSESVINDPGLVPMFIEVHNMWVVSFPQLTITLVTPAQNSEVVTLVTQVLDGK
jgi:ribonuclease HI